GDRGGPAALLAGRVDARPGRARDAAVVVREALRGGHRDEGDHRRGAGLRGLRLHQGVPGREADARREAVPDLRGHLADPAPRNRERDLPAARLTPAATLAQVPPKPHFAPSRWGTPTPPPGGDATGEIDTRLSR